MISAEFDYAAPDSLPVAIGALADGGEDAKLLAGGHSLIPLMKLRLAAPSLLVDLRKVPGLHGIRRENGTWRIGSMTPHAELERTPELGIVAQAAGTIADRQVRKRGTIGGSLAHGDPASDLPAVMLICGATLTAQGPGGQRTLAASELFRDYLQTTLEPAEVLTEVRVPALDGWGFGYPKFNRRSEDWAMVAVSALVQHTGGVCEEARIGRNASGDYKRHLARVLCRRALAPVERVWQALIDVERVAPCLPGAAVTGRNDDGSYNGTFSVKIGPTSATYAGKLKMENIDEG